MKKKIGFFALLALAVSLTACTPEASAPESEAAVTTTAEAAPAAEAAENAVVGTLRNLGAKDPADGYYQLDTVQQPDKSYHGILRKVDFATARMTQLCDVGNIEQLGTYFAWGENLCYETWPSPSEAEFHIYTPADGSERIISLESDLSPSFADDQYVYLNRYADPFLSLERMDLNTGDIQPIKTPDLISTIYDTDGQRLLVARLISEIPLESLWDDEEQYEAAMQNATVQYAWWDLATGALETVLEEPFHGEKDENGNEITRIYLGHNADSLFFYRGVITGQSSTQNRVERCALDGSSNEAVSFDLPADFGVPGTVNCGGEIRWLVITGEEGILVYDAATDRSQEVTGGAEAPWPLLLTQDGQVLVSLMEKKEKSDVCYRLIPEGDYLAGNFTGTDVVPAEE